MPQTLTQEMLMAKIYRGERTFQETKFAGAINLNLRHLLPGTQKLDFTGSQFEGSLRLTHWQATKASLALAHIKCTGNIFLDAIEIRDIDLTRALVRGRTCLQHTRANVSLNHLYTDGLAIVRSGGKRLDLTALTSLITNMSAIDFKEIIDTNAKLGETSLLLGDLTPEERAWKALP